MDMVGEDADLRDELQKVTDTEAFVAKAIALAEGCGVPFSAEELHEMAANDSGEMSDDDLDNVTGGLGLFGMVGITGLSYQNFFFGSIGGGSKKKKKSPGWSGPCSYGGGSGYGGGTC